MACLIDTRGGLGGGKGGVIFLNDHAGELYNGTVRVHSYVTAIPVPSSNSYSRMVRQIIDFLIARLVAVTAE